MSYEKQNFEDGQVLTAEHLNRIEDGIAKCPQAWTEYGEVVEILTETDAVYDEDMGYMLLGFLSAPVVGQTCLVNYNGTDYECIAVDLSFLQDGTIGLGDIYTSTNGVLGESATGEPFVIMYMDEAKIGIVQPIVDVTSITVSIHQLTKTVHKLGKEYLPDDIGTGGGGVNVVVVDMDTMVADRNANDIYTLSKLTNKPTFVSLGGEMFGMISHYGYNGDSVDEARGVIVTVDGGGNTSYNKVAIKEDGSVTIG